MFSEKVFDMDFLQNYFDVFLNSPYRETPKNVLKKNARKKHLGLVGSSKVNQIYAGVSRVLF
jgi:hypothetical protein